MNLGIQGIGSIESAILWQLSRGLASIGRASEFQLCEAVAVDYNAYGHPFEEFNGERRDVTEEEVRISLQALYGKNLIRKLAENERIEWRVSDELPYLPLQYKECGDVLLTDDGARVFQDICCDDSAIRRRWTVQGFGPEMLSCVVDVTNQQPTLPKDCPLREESMWTYDRDCICSPSGKCSIIQIGPWRPTPFKEYKSGWVTLCFDLEWPWG